MAREYIQAIEFVNACVRNDDRSTWFPKIKAIDNKTQLHDINGVYVMGVHDARANSILRLTLDDKLPCVLYAYPAEFGIKQQDVLVGFIKNDNKLQLAWDDKRVFPASAFPVHNPPLPRNAKWIIAASLNLHCRRAITLFGQDKTFADLKKSTPVVYKSRL